MRQNAEPPSPRNVAVVVGASLAGLLAARVLAEHFAEVVLLERDELPTGPSARRGTPQVVHAHGLLAHGYQVLEGLFPGLGCALIERGALPADLLANVPVIAGGRRFAPGVAGIEGIAVSRPLLEAEVRQRVLAHASVRARTGVEVLGLVLDARGERVRGVRLRPAGGDPWPVEELAADLVVDASGRGSRLPAWLETLGFDAPEEERVMVGIGYLTAYFRRESWHAPEVGAIVCQATRRLPHFGALIAQEPEEPGGVDRWVVTLGGYAGDHPEPTLEGLRVRARQIGCPEIVRITERAEPLGPVARYSFPHSQRRRYERLRRFPRGLLAFGDSLASFNPIYGQGMTVAAGEAAILRDLLADPAPGLARRFFAAAAHLIDTPWQLAVGGDLAIPSVPGRRPLAVRLVNRYLEQVFVAAEQDPRVGLAFQKVAHMVAAPASLFAPAILARVLWPEPAAASGQPVGAAS